MQAARTVIIIAPSQDVHARSVAYEIENNLGGRAVILDATDYPEQWHLSVSIEGATVSWDVSITGNESQTIRSKDVAGLWWRRVYPHNIATEIYDERARRFCDSEARAALSGWIYGLGPAVINPLKAERAAAQKTFQLTTASQLGLAVPRSVLTNSPDSARAFYKRMNGDVVFKVYTTAPGQMLETRQLLPEHLNELSLLAHAPVIFQERIPGTDIRVTIVDDDVFAIAIRPNHSGAGLDWRLDTSPRYEPYNLPAEPKRQLIALMRALGLRYGAIDLRVTPEGEHVFLEVNTGGQYLFVEIQMDLPISRALGAALLRGAPARVETVGTTDLGPRERMAVA